jgi:hypothetical protein
MRHRPAASLLLSSVLHGGVSSLSNAPSTVGSLWAGLQLHWQVRKVGRFCYGRSLCCGQATMAVLPGNCVVIVCCLEAFFTAKGAATKVEGGQSHGYWRSITRNHHHFFFKLKLHGLVVALECMLVVLDAFCGLLVAVDVGLGGRALPTLAGLPIELSCNSTWSRDSHPSSAVSSCCGSHVTRQCEWCPTPS